MWWAPAGDNPGRLHSEAAFSMLCGASPIPASSGKTVRHRLNRGGNRQANTALYRIVVVRLRWHQPTRDDLAQRTKQALTKQEIIRWLNRSVARQVFPALPTQTAVLRPLDHPKQHHSRDQRFETCHAHPPRLQVIPPGVCLGND
jgi:transposase